MKTNANYLTTICAALALAISSFALAQDDAPAQTLFTNVHIFDGVNEERMAGNVLVEGNMIKQVSEEAINAPGATVIDGGGRTLIGGGPRKTPKETPKTPKKNAQKTPAESLKKPAETKKP